MNKGQIKCHACGNEVDRDSGIFLAVPSEGSLNREQVIADYIGKYGQECPFICVECYRKESVENLKRKKIFLDAVEGVIVSRYLNGEAALNIYKSALKVDTDCFVLLDGVFNEFINEFVDYVFACFMEKKEGRCYSVNRRWDVNDKIIKKPEWLRFME